MINKLIEKAIEIEGLLRIIRDRNPLPETYTMLSNKVVELAEEAMILEEKAYGNGNDIEEPQNSETTENIAEIREEELTQEPQVDAEITEEELPQEPQIATEIIEEEEPIQEPRVEAEIPEEELPQEPQEEDDDIILAFDDDEYVEEQHSEDDDEPADEDDEELEKENESALEIEYEAPIKEPVKKAAKLKASFSLNDRFLYSRELFDGNMRMFDSTLDFIEGIDDFSIIEEYFYNEMEWDRENSTVASFMNILRPNFK